MAGGYGTESARRALPSNGSNYSQLVEEGRGEVEEYRQAKLFRLRFRHLALITVSLPCFAFFFCIIYSFFEHHEWTTRTHCNVWNIAPSISASIGNFAPQKYVWKTCIALHSAPRLLICQMYHTHMSNIMHRVSWVQQMTLLSCTVSVAEVFSLLLLSIVPSIEDFALHKLAFGSFLFFSALYVATSYYLFSTCRNSAPTQTDKVSLIHKRRLLLINFSSILAAMYCYWRHNTYCEPGMYSIFSLFEYTVVLSNMAYHFTSYWDFHPVVIDLKMGLGTHADARYE